MDKEAILDYVTKTPENTNRNVLGSMLNQFVKGSGGGGVLYALMGTDPPQTDPALEEFIIEHPDATFTNTAIPVSIMPNGEPMDYAALADFFKENVHMCIVYSVDGAETRFFAINAEFSDGIIYTEENVYLVALIRCYYQGDYMTFGLNFIGNNR